MTRGTAKGRQIGSKRLIMPDTCPDRGSRWSFRRSGRCSGRSVKPSADPRLVRTRHLLILLARGSRRDHDHPVRNAEAQSPTGAAQSAHRSHLPELSEPVQRFRFGGGGVDRLLPISGCLAPSRRGNAALSSPTSADASGDMYVGATAGVLDRARTAGARRRAPAAHAPGLHCRQRPGHAQRRVRRPGCLQGLRPARADFFRRLPSAAMSRAAAAGMYR